MRKITISKIIRDVKKQFDECNKLRFFEFDKKIVEAIFEENKRLSIKDDTCKYIACAIWHITFMKNWLPGEEYFYKSELAEKFNININSLHRWRGRIVKIMESDGN